MVCFQLTSSVVIINQGQFYPQGPRKHGVLTPILLKELLREESVLATAPPPTPHLPLCHLEQTAESLSRLS